MRNSIAAVALGALAISAALGAALTLGPGDGTASSHREAPLIADDPSADLTDVYAFRSPDRPSTVTILANVIPGEDPAAGPNWSTFSPAARYNLKIDTTGDVRSEVVYRFEFPADDRAVLPRRHRAAVHAHADREAVSPAFGIRYAAAVWSLAPYPFQNAP